MTISNFISQREKGGNKNYQLDRGARGPRLKSQDQAMWVNCWHYCDFWLIFYNIIWVIFSVTFEFFFSNIYIYDLLEGFKTSDIISRWHFNVTFQITTLNQCSTVKYFGRLIMVPRHNTSTYKKNKEKA